MGVFTFKPTKGPNQAKNGKTSSFGTLTTLQLNIPPKRPNLQVKDIQSQKSISA